MGDSGIALGNAFGSVIANIGLIVGIIALIVPVKVDTASFRNRATWMFGVMVLVIRFDGDRCGDIAARARYRNYFQPQRRR